MRDPDRDFDSDEEDPFKDSSFEDEETPPLETPDADYLDAHTGERGVLPLGYQGLGKGSTPAEEEAGDTLDERLQREEPDVAEIERRHEGEQLQIADVEDVARPDREGSALGQGFGGPADPEGDELSAADELSAEEAAVQPVDEP
jgi:hypothetical protein